MAYNLTETEANTIQDILTALEKIPDYRKNYGGAWLRRECLTCP